VEDRHFLEVQKYPPYLETVSVIRNPRARHAFVTGTHITVLVIISTYRERTHVLDPLASPSSELTSGIVNSIW